MTVAVHFSVEAELEPHDIVCVTGDCKELGNWDPDKALALECQSSDGNRNVWSRVIALPKDVVCSYRYFICRFLDRGDDIKKSEMVIVRWETNLNPRKLSSSGDADERKFPEVFGHHDGRLSEDSPYGYNFTSKGWLRGQTCIQIRLHSNPIYMWKHKHWGQIYRVKCMPLDYNVKDYSAVPDSEEDSRDGPPPCTKTRVHVSVLNGSDFLAKPQNNHGQVFNANDYLVFRSESFQSEYLGFQLEFYVHDPTKEMDVIPKYVGYSHILPLNHQQSLGQRRIPIMGLKHKPIGEVTVEYFIIKPFNYHDFKMDVSYQNHWKSLGRSLDVGHRGMGSSYKRVALVKENTVASLQTAGKHGADFVEFDVMLTKDHHPVVYHDFNVCLTFKKRVNGDQELFEIPVHGVTLCQLQSMKLSHASSQVGDEIDLSEEKIDSPDLQPFPTLRQCFEGVDKQVGFNIEVKHPQQTEDGKWEIENYFDHNIHVDRILQDVFEMTGSRRLIFSSFDADTCIMLQLKQNKYPVLLLSNGPTKRYTPYKDFRARTFEAGISFALSESLLGVDFQSEGLLQDLSIIQKTKDAGLVLFVWGDDNNDADTIKLLRQKGVDGIIYDRIDFYETGKAQQFELKTVSEELLQLGIASSHTLQKV